MENNKKVEKNSFGSIINSCFFGFHQWSKWTFLGAGVQTKTCLKCNKKKANYL